MLIPARPVVCHLTEEMTSRQARSGYSSGISAAAEIACSVLGAASSMSVGTIPRGRSTFRCSSTVYSFVMSCSSAAARSFLSAGGIAPSAGLTGR